ncbi:AMP-dependent synthetase [Actinomadura craniellae]|uniref:AMP-dependent synthetase n=1 Tax=Actinomadura craniellae TaxID=2231787 RepID=A0A365H7C2_9ACTN|nr:fatty acyl-AMP ligase [Actinomadura craniellae]RAY14876.1 AMP-dependent synthetase [Actinomadura craniellae]
MALGALLPELDQSDPDWTPLVTAISRHAETKPAAPAYTFVDYSGNPAGTRTTLNWAQMDARSKAMAARLRRSARPGERVALLLPQGLDYLVTMCGAMLARVIAVPLFSPDLAGHGERLIRVYADADPAVVVTSRSALSHVEKFFGDQDVPRPREIVIADDLDLAPGETWHDEPAAAGDVAYLQYTSGSTRTPAGVEVTHGNLDANARQVLAGWTPDHPHPKMVSWLPLFHDMGLVNILALTMVDGHECILMDPLSFLMNPLRWLRLISECEAAYTSAPNFAYEYAAAQATPAKLADIDLSGLVNCLNGAEPIRTSTLEVFSAAFTPVGLRPGAPTPGYGLAEATVFVSAAADDVPPTVVWADREELARGALRIREPGGAGVTGLVGCGRPIGQHVAIVDPDTGVERPDGMVGEVWIHGPNVAAGYWRNPERTASTFGGVLTDPAGGLPAGPWLRTGDYGLAHEGELYITGRIKDLVIVDGRNHYPQDIEETVYEAHPAIRQDHVAAFAVVEEDAERLVVVAERNRRVPLARLDLGEVERAVRGAVNVAHELAVHEFALVEPGMISRTSSGKIARAATRERHLAGALARTADRLAARTT